MLHQDKHTVCGVKIENFNISVQYFFLKVQTLYSQFERMPYALISWSTK